jgi:hypothetical protein
MVVAMGRIVRPVPGNLLGGLWEVAPITGWSPADHLRATSAS